MTEPAIAPQELDVSPEDGGDLMPSIDLGARQLKRQALDSLFARAMSGLLPRSRALKSWEPDQLDERHLHAILLRAGGMAQKQIATYLGWEESWTSIVLNHPDAQYVLTRLLSYAADNVIDMEARIKATAPEAFDHVVEVMRSTQDEALRSKNAFEILKLAGYGAQKGGVGAVNVQINNNNQVPSRAIEGLSVAIQESRQIASIVIEQPTAAQMEVSRLELESRMPPGAGSPESIDAELDNLQLIERSERVA